MSEFGGIKEILFGPKEVIFSNGIKMKANLGREPKILLKKGNEVLIDLKTFAPDNTIIQNTPNKEWSAITSDNVFKRPPIIRMGKISGVTSILDYLHECGHLQNPELSNESSSARQNYDEKYFNMPPENTSLDRIDALKQRNDAMVLSERTAWAYALKSVRDLQKDLGVNIVEKIGGTQSVFNYINKCIKAYKNLTSTELEYLGFEGVSIKFVENALRFSENTQAQAS